MVTTRRSNGGSAYESTSTTSTPSKRSAIPPPTHSAYLPTGAELSFLAIYPLTLFMGSLFSHLSPTLYPPFNASTYSTVAQSFQPAEHAPSYFAQKRNIFNVYFVKIGWFWCSFALLVFTALSSRGRASRRSPTGTSPQQRQQTSDRLRRLYQTALRWGLATGFWVLTTQWCFGPPIVDRGFALTGGICELAAQNVDDDSVGGKTEAVSVLTHAACNMAHGTWMGGYDISGHVFILVLGSGMLWLEMLPFILPHWKGFGIARVVKDYSGRHVRLGQQSSDAASNSTAPEAIRAAHDAVVDKASELDEQDKARARRAAATIRTYATTMAIITAGLSWWMLLMTAAFFHTWFEKLTGWLLAFGALWAVYVAPRGVPVVREVLGMPGV